MHEQLGEKYLYLLDGRNRDDLIAEMMADCIMTALEALDMDMTLFGGGHIALRMRTLEFHDNLMRHPYSWTNTNDPNKARRWNRANKAMAVYHRLVKEMENPAWVRQQLERKLTELLRRPAPGDWTPPGRC